MPRRRQSLACLKRSFSARMRWVSAVYQVAVYAHLRSARCLASRCLADLREPVELFLRRVRAFPACGMFHFFDSALDQLRHVVFYRRIEEAGCTQVVFVPLHAPCFPDLTFRSMKPFAYCVRLDLLKLGGSYRPAGWRLLWLGRSRRVVLRSVGRWPLQTAFAVNPISPRVRARFRCGVIAGPVRDRDGPLILPSSSKTAVVASYGADGPIASLFAEPLAE